jgi:methyltransferase (TIGR00027 family)
MSEPLIRDVSDTAFWIAYHRAQETGRPDALFRDPLAGRLAGERGREIALAMPTSLMIGWSVTVRTRIVDDYIASAVAGGVDTVLNLGAGLDTRPYRMDLPASLRWIEADYPHIVDHKAALLAGETPRCRLERVKIDLADRPKRKKFLAARNAGSNRMLLLTEGVVPYLNVEEAASLADDLRRLDHLRYWVVDYFSPEAAKYRRRKGMEQKMRNAPFRFEPGDWHAFFHQHGWRASQSRYLPEEGEKLGRPMPLPWPIKAVWGFWSLFLSAERREALRKFAGYVLLEPVEA